MVTATEGIAAAAAAVAAEMMADELVLQPAASGHHNGGERSIAQQAMRVCAASSTWSPRTHRDVIVRHHLGEAGGSVGIAGDHGVRASEGKDDRGNGKLHGFL